MSSIALRGEAIYFEGAPSKSVGEAHVYKNKELSPYV